MSIVKAMFRAVGGVHPDYRKSATAQKAVREMPLPALLRVSTAQHLGAPSRPVAKKGDAVLRGARLAEPAGFISAAVHSPTSGVVKAIADAPTPTGATAPAIEIEPDGRDAWDPSIAPKPDWQTMSSKNLAALVVEAGIVGMGGAGFPTHVKLSPPPNKPIDTLILNGAECEPYLTADHRLMIERAEQVWAGAEIIRHILGAKTVRVAIEDNKPDAVRSMERAMAGAAGDVAIAVLKTSYPQGAEKQQIYGITGREVPTGGLPMDVGCVVENVGTALAIFDAIVNGRPLTERITTVTGSPVADPSNVLARVGTPYGDLVSFCGGTSGPVAKWISGGPMMGFAQHSLETPTTKTTSGLVALAPGDLTAFASTPCISCSRCVTACPMKLLPCELSQILEAEDYAAAEALNVLDCIECGCCAFECPSRRPLVQHMRRGKARAMARRRAEEAKKKGK